MIIIVFIKIKRDMNNIHILVSGDEYYDVSLEIT